jgi:hypothetical protein
MPVRRSVFSALAVLLLASPAIADVITVPNYSFENPVTPFATPSIDVWQSSFGYASQTAGVFVNTGTDAADHITNLDQNQAAFMFQVTGLSLSQTLSDTFQAGSTYQLTVGIQGGGGMPLNAPMALELYYLDGGGNPVPVATSTVLNTNPAGNNITFLPDRQLLMANPVLPGDPEVGKNIGVALVQTQTAAGQYYWDLDNVRLATVPEPGSIALLAAGGLGLCVLARRRMLAKRACAAGG